MTYGLTGIGTYIPRLRLERAAIADAHRWVAPSLRGLAKGKRAFCSWDEDVVTMGVEAARACLPPAMRKEVRSVTLASTTFPYDDLQAASIVAGALELDKGARTSQQGGSQRAGTSALLQAFESGREQALLIAADRLKAKPASTQEMVYGAGAAALTFGSDGVIAYLVGKGTTNVVFVDHFRPAGASYDYFWEERWIRDEGYLKIIPPVAKRALEDADLTIADIDWLAMPSPMKGVAEAVSKAIGFTGSLAPPLDSECGYTGVAHAMLLLAGVLEQANPGERIMVVGFGQGADVLILEVTDAITERRGGHGISTVLADCVITQDYLRMLSFYDAIDLERGMRAEKIVKPALTTQYREAGQLEAFAAGRCRACGTVQFPQLAYCVNPECNSPASNFQNVSLVDEPLRVFTFTSDWLSYHPAPPLQVGFVQFDIGARLLMEMVDTGPGGPEIGMPLRVVARIKERDPLRGYNRYFWKATPLTV